jgi:hypothetical protein
MKSSRFDLMFMGWLTAVLPAVSAEVAVAPAAGVTNSAEPKIQFASLVHDFGKIPGATSVKHEFIFTNTGNALLEVTDVQPSCGCTTAGGWTREVEPGKTGTIPIQFNSGTYNGLITRSITVTCNDKSQPNLALQIKATVWKPIEVNPQYAILNALPDSPTNPAAVVRISNHLDEPITLSDPRSSSAALTAELKTIQPGKEFELTIKAVSPLPAEAQNATISIPTSWTNTPVISVSAMLMIQPAMSITPQQIVLPVTVTSNSTPQTVWIRNNTATPLKLSDPMMNAVGVKIQMTEEHPGRDFKLMVSFPPGFEMPKGERLELTVKSSSSQRPVIKVPVTQAQRPIPVPTAGRPVPPPTPTGIRPVLPSS